MASPVSDYYGCTSGGVIAGGRSVRPYLFAIGHSIISGSKMDVPAFPYLVGMRAESPHKWMNSILGMPFDYLHSTVSGAAIRPPVGGYGDCINGFYGESGQVSATINESVQNFHDELNALKGDRRVVCAIMAEVNDMTGGISASTTWGNYQSMLSKLADYDVLLTHCVPSTYLDTVTEGARVDAFNSLLDAGTESNIKYVVDWTTPYLDTVASGKQPLSGYTSDGTHLNAKGALTLGLAAANAIGADYPRWRALGSDVVCSHNPTLSGTGGTLGANASGVVPNGFTLSANLAGFSVVGSQGDGYYQMVFSYSGSSVPYGSMGLSSEASMSNCTAGSTVIQNIGDIEVVECTNMQFGLTNQCAGGYQDGEIPFLNGTIAFDVLAGRRICLHTEPHVIPAAATRANTSFKVFPLTGAATASLTIRIRWMGTMQYRG